MPSATDRPGAAQVQAAQAITYLDASALVKRYVRERGTTEVLALVTGLRIAGTAIITRAEVAAALAKAVRVGALDEAAARAARNDFDADWPHLVRIAIGEDLVGRAAALAFDYGLRGYDAVHLAAALAWQSLAGVPVTMATFDDLLWRASARAGLAVWPPDLRPFIRSGA